MRSNDGITWTNVNAGSGGFNSIAWNGEFWLIASNTTIYKSINGINFQPIPFQLTYQINSVSWDQTNKLWIISANYVDGNFVAYSPDAVNWTSVLIDVNFTKIISTGSRYLAHNNLGGSLAYSSSLTEWAIVRLDLQYLNYSNIFITDMFWTGNKVLIAAQFTLPSGDYSGIFNSDDGVNYSLVYSTARVSDMGKIAEFNGYYYVSGLGKKSSNGVNWVNDNSASYIWGGVDSNNDKLCFTSLTFPAQTYYLKKTDLFATPSVAQLFSSIKSRFIRTFASMTKTCANTVIQLNTIYTNSLWFNVSYATDGGTNIIQRGLCYNTTGTPTIADSHTTDLAGGEPYLAQIDGLNANTIYYVRAYTINATCTSYSNEVSAQTYTSVQPSVQTVSITNITNSGATLTGNVMGGGTILSRGFCYSTSPNPDINSDNIGAGSGMGEFTANVTGLDADTHYYVRAYAENSSGYAYGQQLSFTTGIVAQIPTLQGISFSDISLVSAKAYSNFISDGGSPLIAFGFCYSTTNPIPTLADTFVGGVLSEGVIYEPLVGLTAGTQYYARAYATNAIGTAYSPVGSFNTGTQYSAPIVSTTGLSYLSSRGVGVTGRINSDGGSVLTDHGFQISLSSDFNSAGFDTGGLIDENGDFSISYGGLAPNTQYFTRAYAINAYGASYGSALNLTTLQETLSYPRIDIWYSINSPCGAYTVTSEATAKQLYLDYINTACSIGRVLNGDFGRVESLTVGKQIYDFYTEGLAKNNTGWYTLTEGYVVYVSNGIIQTIIPYPW
jgi:hypothetical protein